MRKTIALVLMITIIAIIPVMAGDHGAGRSKLGTILGRGVFVTYGIPTGEVAELNIFAGTDWYITYIDVGANYLFRLVDVNIQGEIFPLSLGPQADVAINFDDSIDLGILADLRWEYTFKFPLNLFIELGLGINMGFYDDGVSLNFGWQGGLGIRYVFQ